MDRRLHELGVARCRQAQTRNLSLTDSVSLAFMQQAHIREAIAFDRHFTREGIQLP